MASITSNLTTFSTAALSGSTADWKGADAANAQTSDDSRVSIDPAITAGTGPHITNYLKGRTLSTVLPSNAQSVNHLDVQIERSLSAASRRAKDNLLYLTDGSGTVLTSINRASEFRYSVNGEDDGYDSHIFTWADLEELGITLANLQSGAVGFALSSSFDDRLDVSGGMPRVDHVRIFILYDADTNLYMGPVRDDGDIEGGDFCAISGMWFPASRLRVMHDGRVVGDKFFVEEGPR